MPLVQYSHPSRSINVTKVIQTPKAVTALSSWVLAARKVIPIIPRFMANNDEWAIRNHILTEQSIIFEVYNKKTYDKFALVFDRKRDTVGVKA